MTINPQKLETSVKIICSLLTIFASSSVLASSDDLQNFDFTATAPFFLVDGRTSGYQPIDQFYPNVKCRFTPATASPASGVTKKFFPAYCEYVGYSYPVRSYGVNYEFSVRTLVHDHATDPLAKNSVFIDVACRSPSFTDTVCHITVPQSTGDIVCKGPGYPVCVPRSRSTFS